MKTNTIISVLGLTSTVFTQAQESKVTTVITHAPVAEKVAKANVSASPEDAVRWSAVEGDTSINIRLITEEASFRTYIGVAASKVPAELYGQITLPASTGLLVNHLTEGGPAEKAGLQKGDVLAKLDDQLLINPEQFAVLIGSKKKGDPVKMSFLRKGQSQEITVVLAEREEVEKVKSSFRIGDEDVVIDAEDVRPIRTYTKQYAKGVPTADPELVKKLGEIQAALDDLKGLMGK